MHKMVVTAATSISVATSLWATACACLSDPMATFDRALLTLCQKTPLLWRLKLAALLTVTPREAQHFTERIVMLAGSMLLLWACWMGFRLLTSMCKVVGQATTIFHASKSPVDAQTGMLERGSTISFSAADGKSCQLDEYLRAGRASSASFHAPSSPTTEITMSSTPSNAQSWTHEVPQVFLTPPSPPSPTLCQLRYLARKMPASYRMSKLMRPAVGYWPPDYLAAFDNADRTGLNVKLRWRQVREDLATGKLTVLSEVSWYPCRSFLIPRTSRSSFDQPSGRESNG